MHLHGSKHTLVLLSPSGVVNLQSNHVHLVSMVHKHPVNPEPPQRTRVIGIYPIYMCCWFLQERQKGTASPAAAPGNSQIRLGP